MSSATLLLAVAAAAGAVAARAATPLEVSPGLWQQTITVDDHGAPNRPQPAPATAPAAERRAHSALRAKPGQGNGPVADVQQACITAADLATGDDAAALGGDASCKSKLTRSTPTHRESEAVCKSGTAGAVRTVRYSIDVLSREHTRSDIRIKIDNAGKTSESHVMLEGKWLSADCSQPAPSQPVN
jgi:hypothetical protein